MADRQDVPNAVQRSHRILASYALASTTPTSHVSRHLHTMTVGAPIPYSYHPQDAYSTQYQPEISYLSSYQAPTHNPGYWHSTTNDASTYLGINHFQAYEYPSSNQWFAGQPSSAYTPSAFSQSLYHPSYAASAYPTPPPPPRISSSSSSLAFALGRPPEQTPAKPDDSAAFFNEFLAQKAADLRINAATAPEPVPPLVAPQRLNTLTATPRKRKPTQQLQSPPKKRTVKHDSSEDTRLERTNTPKSHGVMYVDVPPAAYLTPSSSNTPTSSRRSRTLESKSDTREDHHDEDVTMSPPPSVAKGSARRTGDRDDRGPLDKLRATIEDIFEAEDSLDPDTTELPGDMFSPLSTSGSQPHLHSAQIDKLIKQVENVARPGWTRVGGSNSRRSRGRLTEMETVVLGRLLKTLDRSVKAGELVLPFTDRSAGLATATSSSNVSPTKKSTKKGKGKVDEMEQLGDYAALQLDESAHEKLERDLDTLYEGILAANCCMALLSSDRLPKELYSEELIASILQSVKNLLTNVIYPIVEAADIGLCAALYHLVKASPVSKCIQYHRNKLDGLHQGLLALIPRFVALITASSISMSDSIIIQTVYIAIGPFFIVEQGENKKEDAISQVFGKAAMRALRLQSLALIRSVFAHHQDQRTWIIEEILGSLIKLSDTRQKAGQFKLRDGRSIRTVSALLLQLIQTSVHDIRLDAAKIDKQRQQDVTLRTQENSRSPTEGFDELDREETALYYGGLESATKAAKSIVLFLNQRSGKGKTTKNANEAEYRAIFDALMSDVLIVLHWPEWPAASLLLNIASKFMVSSLDDVKSATTDNNAAKSTALEHLGVIAARIRSSSLAIQARAKEFGQKPLKSIDEIASEHSVNELQRLATYHKEVWRHLERQSDEDQGYNSARELRTVIFAQELASVLKVWYGADEMETSPTPFALTVKSIMHELWKRPDGDVFDSVSQEDSLRYDQLAKEIGSVQSLNNCFQPILAVVLHALDAPIIFMRTKALKALGQIVGSDQSVLAAANVRQAIEVHLLDNSPAVRDAAVELIGKYALESSDVAESYWEKIADRVVDTSVSVRKRVIKLLKTFYLSSNAIQRRADIATRLVHRILDEDSGVKDLALKTLSELWFEERPAPTNPIRARSYSQGNDDTDLVDKVAVIMEVGAAFNDRHSALEELLQTVVTTFESAPSQFTQICQTLVDGLVDATDAPGFTVPNCIRTLYLFASAYPPALSSSNASTLLPYLKTSNNTDEPHVVEYLLKIFRSIVPRLSKTSIKFGQELQQILQPLIIKPASAGGVQTLQEVVACMCAVVQYLTHDYARLVALFKTCNARLQTFVQKPEGTQLDGQDIRTLSILIFIVSLLSEHFDFDSIRGHSPAINADLNAISQNVIIEHVYTTLLRLHNKCNDGPFRGRIVQCLGFLFNARPVLMNETSSSTIMKEIFGSKDEIVQARLLKILRDFLESEYEKQTALQKANQDKPRSGNINMSELIGNTDGFADSGVASGMAQQYIDYILKAALSSNVQLQTPAIDILTFVIKDGLAHPMAPFPTIIALETSDKEHLSNRASALHVLVHNKHTSLVNTKFSECARQAFEYQVSLNPDKWQGFRMKPTPVAHFQRWYTLVREKRPSRLEFLRAHLRVFNVDTSLQSTQDKVNFARYMAENFSAFDYKTQEEVFTVVKQLTAVLSTSGMQVLHVLSPGDLVAQLHVPDQQQTTTPPISTTDYPPDVVRTSVIVGVVIVLKTYLKTLYGLSEEKCSKFTLGKKSALGDRPAVKRHANPISWQQLPFAVAPLTSPNDFDSHRAAFLQLWQEDGVTVDLDDGDLSPA